MSSAIVDALLSELDEQALARLAKRLAPYLETSTDQPALLTPAEAASILRCNRKRVYEIVERGALPAQRDGARLLIHRDDLNAYLTSAAA